MIEPSTSYYWKLLINYANLVEPVNPEGGV